MRIGYIITSINQLIVKDHDLLTGLSDDDHTQYLNNARHDLTARHPLANLDPLVCSEAEADSKIATHAGAADPHSVYLNNARHDTTARHPLANLDPLVCSEAEADSKIALHSALANVHHNESHDYGMHQSRDASLFIPAGPGYLSDTEGYVGSYHIGILPPTSLHSWYFTLRYSFAHLSLTNIKLVWICPAEEGALYFALAWIASASGEVYNQHTGSGGYWTVDSGGPEVVNVTELTSITNLGAINLNDFIGFRIYRNPTHANDTLEENVWLLGMIFNFSGVW